MANFMFLPTTEPDRMRVGLEWILCHDGNPKILLSLLVPQERGWVSPTREDPYMKALQPALDADLLVISAGGNSRAHNNLHPTSHFVIGGFDDKGSSDKSGYDEHPSASHGFNGDGYWRPDLLAPYTYLPVPI
ncbi:hypothetical protein J2Z48_000645 [Croceifilum oryzae]|uniref:Peptidase S8/S53 domain-containing protein n=1 Tax=Croceifilum oryzae TaxID=1553429 RepID=A0AAJ1THW6_9BACL|nr:hypothetical protein [Croceifilum oryzae]MDQ0416481.1 hypothetical protein [Croceifilum oryzae]